MQSHLSRQNAPLLWRQTTKRISGPVSLHVFHDVGRTGNTLYLMGDFHESLANSCAACTLPDCESVVKMIADFMARETGLQIDFYQEIPFKDKTQTFAQIKKHTEDVRGYLDGEDTFRDVYLQFRDSFYKRSGPSHVRFHYADIRDEQNVFSLTNFTMLLMDCVASLFDTTTKSDTFDKACKFMLLIMYFLDHLSDRDKYRRFMQIYLYDDNYYNNVNKLFNSSLAKFVNKILRRPSAFDELFHKDTQTSLPGHPNIHRVRKQMLKLPLKQQAAIQLFFDDSLEAMLSRHADFNEVVRRFQRLLPGSVFAQGPTACKAWIAQLHTLDKDMILKLAESLSFLFLHSCVLLMDTYLMARMLHYTNAEKPMDVGIIFAGNFHVENYLTFLTKYMHLKPDDSIPVHLLGKQGPNRCLAVSRGIAA